MRESSALPCALWYANTGDEPRAVIGLTDASSDTSNVK